MNRQLEILSTQEYLERQAAFIEKHGKYLKDLAKINRNENAVIEHLKQYDKNFDWEKYSRSELYNDFENQRAALKSNYEGYASLYDADFCCELTLDNIDKLISPECENYELFKRDIKMYTDKDVVTDYNERCHCLGFIKMPDDIYYHLENIDTKKRFYISACITLTVKEK
jgi:hypothetical protein